MATTFTSLADAVADAGIRLKSQRAGHEEHVRCPRCEGGRSREISLSVKIDEDGQGFAAVCHRGSCGWRTGVRLHADGPPLRRPEIRKPAPHTPAQTDNRPTWLYEFFDARNIGAHTVREFGVYATSRTFGNLGERPAIVFPYVHAGEVVNRKYRPHPDKNPQLQERDALPTLFNVDRLGSDPDSIVWVEGEPDVMALFECGIPHAVTLKDGAPSSVNAANEKRFEALRTHAELLEKPKKIVLAGDNDGPGLALREELARRLGRHRCWIADWPEGCKDASDALARHGPDAVRDAIERATPYPIGGLQRVTSSRLLALRHMDPPSTLTTGCRASDAVVKLPAEGRLIVVTGIPSHGKTSWTRFVMMHTADRHGRRWAVFSPEMQPWEQFVAQCIEALIGKPFWPKNGHEGMTDAEIQRASDWLETRLTMIVCDAEDEAPTLDWLLERARAAVLRDGVTDLLIDPWNEVDHARPEGVSETEFIGRSLQRLKAFALRHGCNVWIIAHPAKPMMLKTGDARPAPGLYDINGSAHWANKADVGLTVHSPAQGTTELHVLKCRLSRWGRRGDAATMAYDPTTGRYSTQAGDAA